MRSVTELSRSEHDRLAFSSILERAGDSRKTFFSSLLGELGCLSGASATGAMTDGVSPVYAN